MNLGVGREWEAALPGREYTQWRPLPISKSCPGLLPTHTKWLGCVAVGLVFRAREFKTVRKVPAPTPGNLHLEIRTSGFFHLDLISSTAAMPSLAWAVWLSQCLALLVPQSCSPTPLSHKWGGLC